MVAQVQWEEQAPTVGRLTNELRAQAATMGAEEARLLVDTYYQQQDYRKRAANQVRAGEQEVDDAPLAIVDWVASYNLALENRIRSLLHAYADGNPVGRWSLSIHGIGPVISAGLLAHIDIEKAPTVGHIWRFAGYDPTSKWEKGQKRPWNARLKVICWHIGECIVRASGSEKDVYGKLWRARREYEDRKSVAGDYAERAAVELARVRRTPLAAASKAKLEAGQLTDGHLHARAKRFTVKIVLSHWHHVAYEVRYGVPPPLPYILSSPDYPEHVHFLSPPNWPM